MAGPYSNQKPSEDANEGGPVYVDPRTKKHAQRQQAKRGHKPASRKSKR
jgi:hypothetical protein